MASSNFSPGNFQINKSTDIGTYRFGIVVAEWNELITESLYSGAYQTLISAGASNHHIDRMNVPGAFELSLGGQWMAKRNDIDAVICLGCVIQGETPHFDFICDAVANGITNVNLKYNKPVILGVLTTRNIKQALDRVGGKYGNKGEAAAMAAIKMILNIKKRKS